MVTFDYLGRSGNNIFQYVFARLLAEKNGLELETEWQHHHLVKMTTPQPGQRVEGERNLIRDTYSDSHNQDWIGLNWSGKRVHLHGFFQHPKFYDQNRQHVESFFDLKPVQKRSPDHTVMHVRMTDYAESKNIINPQYYFKCLQACQCKPRGHGGKKLFIVTDEPTNWEYLHHFDVYQPEIVSVSPEHDWNFIREFDNIICGNSSFSWWAAWLSNASKIFTFAPWMKLAKGERLHLAYMERARAIPGLFWKR